MPGSPVFAMRSGRVGLTVYLSVEGAGDEGFFGAAEEVFEDRVAA